jgi:hypothetical protein
MWNNLRVAAILLFLFAFELAAADYYLSPRGDDGNPGTLEQPWRSLARVNATSLEPGDRILLEGGRTFAGPLELGPDDRASPTHNIVITSYGPGWAVIEGGAGRAVSVDGCNHVLVHRLRLQGAGRQTGNNAHGLYLARSAGSTIDQVEVSGFRHAGIYVTASRDIRITRVHAHDNGFAGIHSGGERSQNIYVAYALAENNPGDPSVRNNHSGNGIVLGHVDGAVIERSEARYNGWDMPWTGNGPVGIWVHDADRAIIQYCVSHHNRSTAADGGGFDFDGGVTNSVLQYNYSHNNFGSGILICQYEGAPRFAGNVVRYNISQDDGLFDHNAGIFVWVGGAGMESTLVHNNTVWNTKGSAVAYGVSKKYRGHLPRIDFYNNVLVSLGPQIFNRTQGSGTLGDFRGNLYWSLGERGFHAGSATAFETWASATGQEQLDGRLVGLFLDPLLRRTGPALLSDPGKLHALVDFRLLPGSPAIGAGLDLRARFGIDPGPADFFGNPLPREGPLSIGAHEPQHAR